MQIVSVPGHQRPTSVLLVPQSSCEIAFPILRPPEGRLLLGPAELCAAVGQQSCQPDPAGLALCGRV